MPTVRSIGVVWPEGTRRAGRATGSQTWPGKGFNAIFRLYSPQQGWFDKSWTPGDFERVE